MTLLFDLFRGVFIGFGFAIGFLIVLIFLIKIIKKVLKNSKTTQYKPKDLLKAFEKYMNRLHFSENYEEMQLVDSIIKGLEMDIVISDVEKYEIKSDTTLVVDDNDDSGKNKIKLATSYIVVRKKNLTPDTSDDTDNKNN